MSELAAEWPHWPLHSIRWTWNIVAHAQSGETSAMLSSSCVDECIISLLFRSALALGLYARSLRKANQRRGLCLLKLVCQSPRSPGPLFNDSPSKIVWDICRVAYFLFLILCANGADCTWATFSMSWIWLPTYWNCDYRVRIIKFLIAWWRDGDKKKKKELNRPMF